MRKVNKKTKKSVKKSLTLYDRLPNNNAEWYELQLKLTKRMYSKAKEDYLLAQIEKLKIKIKESKGL